ncbi:type VII toxin-antitoxin system MntA family adenylyltransferase antitoxin [Halopiger goleimassiliensis]|uniref:type VII toxin-antitoxin system MntA family adenylyltransferase antitoxin n=1 Tax=Halopiger goleimassiliensis TaxID=1293048 RepID=UPI000677BD7B|nr:nucleotidyltransferase domain-containing protein [Halopiger goleimassiliensis]
MSGRTDATAIDRDAVERVLRDQPVRLAVLFGSAVDGHTHPHSDIDIAVEFDRSVDEVGEARLTLATALSTTLERNDIDLSVLSDLDPRVGYDATTNGIILVGSSDRLLDHRDRFERELGERNDASPGDRFDAVLERIDAHLEG